MEACVKTFWSKVKQGAIPLILLGVLYKLVHIISATGIRVTGWPIIDAPLNVLLVIGIAFLVGHILGYQCVKNWIEMHYSKMWIPGRILFAITAWKHDLEIIEIKTTPGKGKKGCWEYAVVGKGPWQEYGIYWFRVHTLGFAGKPFSRVSVSHTMPTGKSVRDIALIILSFGTLEEPPKKNITPH